jgi:alkylation response protein AidB-like acyl-CoA dehydrogenase
VPDRSYLRWPFLDAPHRALAAELDVWAREEVAGRPEPREEDLDDACRHLVARLAAGGLIERAVGAPGDVRALCLARETLAYHHALADFCFAMQGLGSGAISLFGSDELRARYLPGVADGTLIAAFALSEPDAGSDVAALATTAERDGDGWVLHGAKTWISNGGLADFYCVFARTGEAAGARGLTAFVVDAGTPGLGVAERIRVLAPHPLARLELDGCRVSDAQRLGAAGQGFKVAMATLDVFRPSVGAAALGLARRALDEALARVAERELFGAPMAELPLVQSKLAAMALGVDASALLVYRAAWTADVVGGRVTREAAMAKLHATETAQRVVDDAVQLFGGLGVTVGSVVERLYREVRALRIYEGASEVQQIVIGRAALAARGEERPARSVA